MAITRFTVPFQVTLPDGHSFRATGNGWELRDTNGRLVDHEDHPGRGYWTTETGSPVCAAALAAGLIPA